MYALVRIVFTSTRGQEVVLHNVTAAVVYTGQRLIQLCSTVRPVQTTMNIIKLHVPRNAEQRTFQKEIALPYKVMHASVVQATNNQADWAPIATFLD